jgi:hypothetical protein
VVAEGLGVDAEAVGVSDATFLLYAGGGYLLGQGCLWLWHRLRR